MRKRQLRDSMAQFIRMYNPHEAQDTVLFPAFRKIVSKNEYDSLGEDLEEGAPAIRRGRVREDGGPRGGHRKGTGHLRPEPSSRQRCRPHGRNPTN